MLKPLDDDQKLAVAEDGHVVVTACPGSGKTRVLTYRVLRGLQDLSTRHQFIAAITFTNRASEELTRRIESLGVPLGQLWSGTVHSFCMNWIIRPYACYISQLKFGFTILDQIGSDRLLDDLREELEIPPYMKILVQRNRAGEVWNADSKCQEAAIAYLKIVEERKLLDFGNMIYLSYKLLGSNPQVARTLGRLFPLICVDEYQDIHEIQYGILGYLVRQPYPGPQVFFVGDPNQSIYGGLGASARSAKQISKEFGNELVKEKRLQGCYRSTQYLIDFYRVFQVKRERIEGRGKYAARRGRLVYDRLVQRDHLHIHMAKIIQGYIQRGIPESEIAVVAPQWQLVTPIARQLRVLLPEIGFDAPGLSPISRNYGNPFYKLASLLLTEPSPGRYSARLYWAKLFLEELALHTRGISRCSSRNLLRSTNSVDVEETDGRLYLELAFNSILAVLGIDATKDEEIHAHLATFFEGFDKYQKRHPEVPTDLAALRALFHQRKGIVVNTCHGLKGEEFELVIAFALLRGYIPHWDEIFSRADEGHQPSSKLLYVICSRAKRFLYLIAETGRCTRNGNPLEPNRQLSSLRYRFDGYPEIKIDE